MAKPYSNDLRERVVRAVESGRSRNVVAKQFGVSVSFVVKLMQRWRVRGTVEPDQFGGWKKPSLLPHAGRIRALVEEHNDLTLEELCARLRAEGIPAKRSTLSDFLKAQKITRKKRPRTPPSRSARTSPPRARHGARSKPR